MRYLYFIQFFCVFRVISIKRQILWSFKDTNFFVTCVVACFLPIHDIFIPPMSWVTNKHHPFGSPGSHFRTHCDPNIKKSLPTPALVKSSGWQPGYEVTECIFILCLFAASREQLGSVERSRQKYKAAPLTVEFVPFFYRESPHRD